MGKGFLLKGRYVPFFFILFAAFALLVADSSDSESTESYSAEEQLTLHSKVSPVERMTRKQPPPAQPDTSTYPAPPGADELVCPEEGCAKLDTQQSWLIASIGMFLPQIPIDPSMVPMMAMDDGVLVVESAPVELPPVENIAAPVEIATPEVDVPSTPPVVDFAPGAMWDLEKSEDPVEPLAPSAAAGDVIISGFQPSVEPEWIELFNTTNDAVALDNLELIARVDMNAGDGTVTIEWQLPAGLLTGANIQPHSFFLIGESGVANADLTTTLNFGTGEGGVTERAIGLELLIDSQHMDYLLYGRHDGVTPCNPLTTQPCDVPPGDIVFGGFAQSTNATATVSGGGESAFNTVTPAPDPALLVDGENVIAVLVNQRDSTSSDMGFNFTLDSNLGPHISDTATWSYLDDGTEQPPEWIEPGFVETWATGQAKLGYNDGAVTTLSCGCSTPCDLTCTPKTLAYYFRHKFTVADASLVTSLTMAVLRDDAAIVYLNGTEVWRSNMPAGQIGMRTETIRTVTPATDAFREGVTQRLSADDLYAGYNVEGFYTDEDSGPLPGNFPPGVWTSAHATTGGNAPRHSGTAPVDQPNTCVLDSDCDHLDTDCVEADCISEECVETPTNEGLTCEDGDLCTSGELCTAGACGGGSTVDCGSQVCNPADGVCVDCVVHGDCELGEICNPATFVCEVAPVSFQQGAGGYTGTVDTFLDDAAQSADDNSGDAVLIVDGDDERQILLRFESLFVSQGGPIPDGAAITNATLTVNVTNASATGANLHRMLVTWNDTDTWDSWVGGIDADDADAVSAADTSGTLNSTGSYDLDVTASLQAWSDGATNHGWVFLAAGTDSWQFSSAEGATPPLLTVEFLVGSAPDAPTNPSPADTADGVSLDPVLQVDVSDPDLDDLLDVTFYGRLKDGVAPPDPFTLIHLTDTQHYSQSNPGTFYAITNWIWAEKDTRNIVFTTLSGDIVNVAGDTGQWSVADVAFQTLESGSGAGYVGVDYGLSPGNHDVGDGLVNYNSYFGVDRYFGRPYYQGWYDDAVNPGVHDAGEDNNNHYEFFSAGGMDFIVIHLEWGVAGSPAVLSWADNLLQTHSDRRAIIVSHWLMDDDSGALAGDGPTVFSSLMDRPNLFLMLAGHKHAADGENDRSDLGSGGNTVYTMVADYQDLPGGGNGNVRILEFVPAADEIRVFTYSVLDAAFITDADSQFVLPYDMDGAAPFVQIGATQTGVANGGTASVTWPGLSPLEDYEWYATVSDGSRTTTGPTWGFTTICTNGQCDDGNFCNGTETCDVGGTNECIPGNPIDCTPDLCDPSDGSCVECLVDADCGDTNVCDGQDVCIAGSCTTVPAPDCDDLVACTDDSCDPVAGCVNVDNCVGAGEFCDALSGTCLTAYPLPIVVGDIWKYFKGTAEPAPYDPVTPAWALVGFDDSSWSDGGTGIGYDFYAETTGTNGNGDYEPFITTQIDDMSECTTRPPCVLAGEGYLSVYMRREFHVADPSRVTSMTLSMYSDDGYVAYLNGVEISRARLGTAGTPPAFNAAATGGPAGSPPVETGGIIDVSINIADLVAGTNVLAVQAHNVNLTSRDLLAIPQLSTVETSPCTGDLDCDDANDCTDDTCDLGTGSCVYANNDTNTCDDSVACTNDSCSSGACVSVDACTGGEVCNLGTGICETPVPADPLPIAIGDEFLYFKGTGEPSPGGGGEATTDWTQILFDDSGWLAGDSGFAYGTGAHEASDPDTNTVLGDMQNGYVSAYFRREFHIDNPAAVDTMTLTVDYDDAFVAYVNGVEVARSSFLSGLGNPPAYDQVASSGHEGDTTEVFDFAAAIPELVAGTNVLAIQLHNATLNSSDAVLRPVLDATFNNSCTFDTDCDDSNPCTDDTCPAGICVFTTNDGNSCTDDVACTDDACTSGVCVSVDNCTGGDTCNITTGFCESPALVATFQQGVSGYTGTVDTYLQSGASTADNSTVSPLVVDLGPTEHILLRFENLFTSQGGPIPVGAMITSAILTINVTNESTGVGASLHRMLQTWNDTDNWNTWTGGIQADDVEAVSTADASSSSGVELHDIDVTSSLAAWSVGGANHGWAWLPPATDNSWRFESAEGAILPLLTVTYAPCTLDVQCDDGNDCTADVCNAGNCEYTNTNEGGGCDDGISCTGTDICTAGTCAGSDTCPAGQFCDLGADTCVNLPNTPPDAPANELPADTSTGIDANPQLCVDVTDPDADTMDVSFYGRVAATGPTDDFTIVVLPDTQLYSQNGGDPSIFEQQTQWVIDNQAALNIVFTAHVGDIVNNTTVAQFIEADEALGLLDPAGNEELMPYALGVGNHDQEPAGAPGSRADEDSTTALFNQYFGLDRFCPGGSCRTYYGGNYGGSNDNSYQLFSAGGMDFIVVNIEYDQSSNAMNPGADDGSLAWDVMTWAEGVLAAHPNRRAIINSHYTINGSAVRSPQGNRLRNWFQDNDNIFMMVSGHLWQANRLADPTISGDVAPADGQCDDPGQNCTFTLLADYQNLSLGGNGWMRVMTFSPDNDTIRVRTFSPFVNGGAGAYLEDCTNLETVDCTCDVVGNTWVCGPSCGCSAFSGDHQAGTTGNDFYIKYNMEGGDPFEQIGSTQFAIVSGGQACVEWPGRQAGTEYEWYVDVTDGEDATTSAHWTFASDGACGFDTDCDDGVFCNGAETCDTGGTGTCVAGSDPCSGLTPICDEDNDTCAACSVDADCDDSDLCTTDTCTAGACFNTPQDCSDGNACTDDVCTDGLCSNPYNPTAGCCVDVGDCDDGDVCSIDACNAGTCSNTADPACCDQDADCDDGDVCTADVCLTANVAALSFDGANDHVDMNDPAGLKLSQFTLECWVKWDGGGLTASSGNGGISVYPLVNKGRGQSEDPGLNANYFFGIVPASGNVLGADFEEHASGTTTGQNHQITGSTPVTTGVWHHAAVTYDGCWQLYLDGIPQTPGTSCPNEPPDFDSTQQFSIGAAMGTGAYSASTDGAFNGLIDEVRVWDHARTGAEILAGMNVQITTDTGLVGRWGLDEGSGASAGDSTTSAADGTIVGASWELVDLPSIGSGTCDFDPIIGCCLIDDDCTDDGNLCTDEQCNANSCESVYSPFGGCCTGDAECDDGDVCSADTCDAGTCVNTPGVNCCDDDLDCNDGSICTVDTCGVANAAAIAVGGDATADYVDLGNDAAISDFGTNSFTVEGWFYANSTPSTWDGIFRHGRQGSFSQVAVQFNGSGQLTVSVESTAAGQVDTPGLAITVGTWHHFAAVVDRTANQVLLYLDGGTPSTVGTAWGANPISSTDNVVLGAARGSGGTLLTTGYFDGLIDEIRIWDHARTQGEILADMNSEISSATGLLARYGLNEGTGSTTTDSVGALVGTLTGAAAWETVNLPALGDGQCDFAPIPGCCEADVDCDDSDSCTTDSCDLGTNTCDNDQIVGCCTVDADCVDADPCTLDTCDAGTCSNSTIADCCVTDGDCDDLDACTFDICPMDTNTAALSFDGSGDSVAMGDAPGLGLQEFTLEAWIQWNGGGSTASSGGGGVVGVPIVTKGLGQSEANTLNCNYFLALDATNGRLVADFENDVGGGNNPVFGTPGELTTGGWHHVAATYVAPNWVLYLDGQVHGSASPGGTPESDSIQDFGIGVALNSGGSPTGSFDGLIDEVRVWSRALAQNEIQDNMVREIVSAPDLVGRWGFNEGVGSSAADSTTPAEDGAIVGASWVTAGLLDFGTANVCEYVSIPDCCVDNSECDDGNACTVDECTGNECVFTPIPGCCIDNGDCDDGNVCTDDVCAGNVCTNPAIPDCCLVDNDCDDSSACTTDTCAISNPAAVSVDGADDWVDFGNAASITDFGTGSFTIEGWFYADTTPVTYAGIFRAGRQQAHSQVAVQYNSGLTASVEDTAAHQIDTPTMGINVGQWHHYAMVVDRTTNELRLYLDGGIAAGGNESVADGSAWATNPIAHTDNVMVGAARNGTGDPFAFFDGELDDLRIWNYARTQPEIEVDMFSKIDSAPGLIHFWGFDEGTGSTAFDSVGTDNGTLTGDTLWETTGLLEFGGGDCEFDPVADGSSCDDGVLLTIDDQCTSGVCAGTTVECVSDAQCPDDTLFCNGTESCNLTTNECQSSGDPCAGGAECNDTCDESADNCFTPATTACGDGTDDDCLNPDTCDGAGTCQSNDEPNGTACDDGDVCNVGETCTLGVCGGGGAVDCSGTGDACNANDSCDPAGLEGNCDTDGGFINEGGGCDDGDSCLINDTCSSGVCSGTPPALDDTLCNGEDDDCDGDIDEDYVETATVCGVGACESSGTMTCVGGSETDSCVAGTPAPNDITCDGVDDNCNGTNDEGYVPDDTCFLPGACAAGNEASSCSGGIETACQPGSPSGESEALCNGVDDDCDNDVDEDYVPDTSCFLPGDCSAGDVASSCVAGSETACTTGTPTTELCDGDDNDCDGLTDENPAGDPLTQATTCGQGVCSTNTGFETCIGGVYTNDTCDPNAGATAEVCDTFDNDCDGLTDEAPSGDPLTQATTCGVGACLGNTGVETCVGGVYTNDTCDPNDGATAEVCDNADNDCDGPVDEADGGGPLTQITTCGVGQCAGNEGIETCTGGTYTGDTCDPLFGATPDNQCDGVDNDCDGPADDDYVPTATACGVGECLSAGLLTCVAGLPVDTCLPGLPETEICDGLDNNCDSNVDEDGAALCDDGSGCTMDVCNGASGCDYMDTCPGDQFCDAAGDICATTVRLPTIDVCTGGDLFVPVVVDSIDGLIGMNLGFSYDPLVLAPVEVLAAPASAGYAVGSNLTVPGEVEISLFSPIPGSGGGTVAWVHFTVIGATGSSTALQWLNSALDEGAVGAVEVDGQIDVTAASTSLSLPDDAAGTPGGTVIVPVLADPADGIGVLLTVEFDPTVIQYVDATTTTLSSGFGIVKMLDAPGTLTISLFGVSPLSGTGSIVDIEFLVVGNSGDSSPLLLTRGQIDEGAIPSCLDDGFLRVCGSVAADDLTCDGVDDDCNGLVDDGYVPTGSTCGLGACAGNTGTLECIDGSVVDSCDPFGGAAADDATCDGIDEDCDGTNDNDYIATPTSCGVGQCAGNVGVLACVDGTLADTCDPLLGATEEICDGVDNDCNDVVDDGPSAGDIGDEVRFGPDPTVITWADLPNSNVYNVYKGNISSVGPFSYDHICYEPESPDAQTEDTAIPAAGQVFYYLVSALNSCQGEDTLGTDSSGTQRPNDNPCPNQGFDSDLDGLTDINDNCPLDDNPGQEDQDIDGVGDVCDNCPTTTPGDQRDRDNDGIGNICDDCTDSDADGFGDPGFPVNTCDEDNCPLKENPGQEDQDLDGLGDVCDACDGDPDNDIDFDGVCGDLDICPLDYDPDQEDADIDGVGDVCDTCTDIDGDGFGDPGFPANTCDEDNCPGDDNPGQEDPDGDGVGSICDICPDDFDPGQTDIDFDTLGDACDPCPSNPDPACQPCPPGDDSDGDGVCSSQEMPVDLGGSMDYRANGDDPLLGLTWTELVFALPGDWQSGTYGVGYDVAGEHPHILNTTVPTGAFSIYTRATFDVADPGAIVEVRIGADYGDAYVAWLNGTEIYRSPEMPAGAPDWNTPALNPHEASNPPNPYYHPLVDVTGDAALQPLGNVLAVGVWNHDELSDALILVPQLTLATSVDNCKFVSNPDQTDTDGDGLGDACDFN